MKSGELSRILFTADVLSKLPGTIYQSELQKRGALIGGHLRTSWSASAGVNFLFINNYLVMLVVIIQL